MRKEAITHAFAFLIISITTLAACSGCSTLNTHLFPAADNPVYKGTRDDAQQMARGDIQEPIWFRIGSGIDLPFSLAADTLFLPFDVVACSERSTPDPAKGWTYQQFETLDKAIIEDYHSYIEEKKLKVSGGVSGFYDVGTGQRAVEFEVFTDGNTSWHFALIYDRQNRRLRVVRFGRNWSMC